MPVENSENRRASDQIREARERFKQSKGLYPSVIQVGEELFRRAFPEVHQPHHCGAIAETLVVPRPDICGKFAIVCLKPPELKVAKQESAA